MIIIFDDCTPINPALWADNFEPVKETVIEAIELGLMSFPPPSYANYFRDYFELKSIGDLVDLNDYLRFVKIQNINADKEGAKSTWNAKIKKCNRVELVKHAIKSKKNPSPSVYKIIK